jgi:hypothetical protein
MVTKSTNEIISQLTSGQTPLTIQDQQPLSAIEQSMRLTQNLKDMGEYTRRM